MQRHFDALVIVFIVHVVNTVHGVDIGPREPLHHIIELGENIVVIQHVAIHRPGWRRDLVAADLVAATVDGVEQRLGQIGSGAEELHLLAQPHRRDAAGNSVIVAQIGAHQVIVFVLQRRGFLADLHAIPLEWVRQILRPQDGQVGLRCGAEIGEGVQKAERGAGDQALAVEVHAADAFGRPIRIAGKQRVIIGSAQKPHDPQLDDQLIDQFLRTALRQRRCFNVAFDICIEEG